MMLQQFQSIPAVWGNPTASAVGYDPAGCRKVGDLERESLMKLTSWMYFFWHLLGSIYIIIYIYVHYIYIIYIIMFWHHKHSMACIGISPTRKSGQETSSKVPLWATFPCSMMMISSAAAQNWSWLVVINTALPLLRSAMMQFWKTSAPTWASIADKGSSITTTSWAAVALRCELQVAWIAHRIGYFVLECGDGSKPWYLVNPKIAGKWMFIPLKMYL